MHTEMIKNSVIGVGIRTLLISIASVIRLICRRGKLHRKTYFVYFVFHLFIIYKIGRFQTVG